MDTPEYTILYPLHLVSVYKKRWEISTSEVLYTGFLNFPKKYKISPFIF
jgi:hypothetical protein